MQFSARVNALQPSPIREILSIITRPGMVSFAGGLPAVDSFPDLDLQVPKSILQYGASEGEPELREHLAAQLQSLGLSCGLDQVLILSGSQQGIDLVAKLFIDQGTSVAVESPTYLAALQVFRFFGASFVPFTPATIDGDSFAWRRSAFAYAIPTFQNPTGHCYSAVQRAALAAACDAAAMPLFEDDPYRDLFYEDCERTPVCAQLRRAAWIYQGSFSKSLAPGLRLGFLAASPDLITPLIRLKQAADLHSNRVSQHVVLKQLRRGDRDQQLRDLAAAYRSKRDKFAAALTRHFGELANWHVPAGGLFFWLQLSYPLDTRKLLTKAIEHGVAFMPGEPFYPTDAAPHGTLRLNFSYADAADAERGLAILANLIRTEIAATM